MSKKSITPTIINLNEIKDEPEVLNYSKATGELNKTLNDLIGDNDYKVELTIRSIGDAYELNGTVKTGLDLACSRCAIEFNRVISFEINELLMIDNSKDYKNGSQSRQNYITHNGDKETFCHMVDSSSFDVGEFIHEHIAINEPLHPTAIENCDDSCENLKDAISKGWIQMEQSVSSTPENTYKPFESLANIKLNS